MSRFIAPAPPQFDTPRATRDWVMNGFRELERELNTAGAEEIADAYTVENFTETRTLNAGTATVEDVANVLCTLLYDLKQRGTKRGQYSG